MPELSTPPRRRSTSSAIRASSAGSNVCAVRVIVTPPPTVKVSGGVVVLVSTGGPLGSGLDPGLARRRREKQKATAVSGRSLRHQLLAPPTGGATTEGQRTFSSGV